MSNLSDELTIQLRQKFSTFDRLNTGFIKTTDLKPLLILTGHDLTEPEAKSIITKYNLDLSETGHLSFQTFINIISDKLATIQKDLSASCEDSNLTDGYSHECNGSLNQSQEEMREIFSIFDKDGNGSISSIELRHVMSNLGERLTDEEVDEMIREADVDGDGEINFEEFVKMVSKQR